MIPRNEVSKSTIEAIWTMLNTGDVYIRAAAILLLQEYVKTLVAQGKGEFAGRLVQAFRDEDPFKSRRPRGKENRLCP